MKVLASYKHCCSPLNPLQLIRNLPLAAKKTVVQPKPNTVSYKFCKLAFANALQIFSKMSNNKKDQHGIFPNSANFTTETNPTNKKATNAQDDATFTSTTILCRPNE